MTLFVSTILPKEDIELFEKVRKTVNDLPDIDLGRDLLGDKIVLSCHILARAVADFFSLAYVDGFFADSYEHSWVRTPNEHILDVYPVWVFGGPILLDGVSYLAPGRRLYHKADMLMPNFVRESAIIIAQEFRKSKGR